MDRLVNPKVLEYARRDAERIFVGKTPRGPTTSQSRDQPNPGARGAGRQGRGPAQGRRSLHFRPRGGGDGRAARRRHRSGGGARHNGRTRLRRSHWPSGDLARARTPILGSDRHDCRGRAGSRLAGARVARARHSQSTWASATRRCCASICWLPAPNRQRPMVIVENGTPGERASYRHDPLRSHRLRRRPNGARPRRHLCRPRLG